MSNKNSYNIVQLVGLKLVKEDSFRNYNQIESHHDIVDLMKRYMQGSYREVSYVLGFDNRNRPTVIHQLGVGTLSSCTLPVASVIKPLILANSSTCVLLHSHPSDFMSASDADVAVTKKVKEACKLFEIELLDHVIVSSDMSESLSMRQANASIWW